MGFLDEIGLAGVFKEIKTRLGKKVNSIDMDTELAKKVDKTSLGANNGVAQLDASGTVPASQLPSYVDDVIEGYLNGGIFYKTQTVGTDKSVTYSDEIEGEFGKIYIDKATNDNKIYRYTTAGYVPISDVPEATLKDIAQLKIDVEKLVNITWSELKALRDAGNLIPGLQYRITDYLCTTIQENTTAVSHQFDIIVTADSKSKLNETARAIRHDGDENLADATSETVDGVTTKTAYFASSKLEAWKIWYCLDNDTNRFKWADTTNGKGVIYRMIDEFNNDCPYDFKNIQFKRYKILSAKSSDLAGSYLAIYDNDDIGLKIDSNDSRMFYTFSYLGPLSNLTNYKGTFLSDASIVGNTRFHRCSVCNNRIKTFIDDVQNLNNIVFLTYLSNSDNYYAGCHSNSFGNDCYDNSFGDDCISNSFGNRCYSNSFDNSCYYNSFGNGCYDNSFGNDCISNSFGNRCYSNSFGNGCNQNSFGDGCNQNSFGNGCIFNSFGYACKGNSFGLTSSDKEQNAVYKYNKIDNGVQYVIFNGVGNSRQYVQNYHIKQGMTFTASTKYTITAKLGLAYETTVAKQSDGTVVEYNEADLLKAIQTSAITNSAKSNLD